VIALWRISFQEIGMVGTSVRRRFVSVNSRLNAFGQFSLIWAMRALTPSPC
jgi:hypothetical protein